MIWFSIRALTFVIMLSSVHCISESSTSAVGSDRDPFTAKGFFTQPSRSDNDGKPGATASEWIAFEFSHFLRESMCRMLSSSFAM